MHNNLSIFICLIAGISSFFSPCILPLIPIYFSYITGYSFEELFKKDGITYFEILIPTLFFIFGFTIIFTLLGASSTFIGNLIVKKKEILRYIGGGLIIFFGLHIIGVIKIKKLYFEKKINLKKKLSGYLGSFILGIGLAAGWSPCIGPILSSILILSSMEDTVRKGILLLFFYSIGLGIPFILISIFIKRTLFFLNKIKKHYRKIEIIIGLLLILFGLLLILNKIYIIIP
ncbi:MAG: cytochrome c biogenesis protein CcdA [Candidatus Omnitrophica bacterium]|nr:cytochrome c biogenesis protein CcdA [Candidatus Omnitrophota bacterium]MCM8832840.1 cytochrome c biogenesis protein CcdA [Candidatus Omnitrophota bacterium]